MKENDPSFRMAAVADADLVVAAVAKLIALPALLAVCQKLSMHTFSLTSLSMLVSVCCQKLFAVSSSEEISTRRLPGQKTAFKIMKAGLLKNLILKLLAGLSLLAMPVHAQVVLFNNLAAGSPNGSMGVTNNQWMAQAFSTTSEGFILSNVSLRLWNLNETSGNFEIQVWDSSGASTSPGQQVGNSIYTGLAQNLGNSTESLLTISGLSVNLEANTDYYLVAAGKTLADVGDPFDPTPGFLYWDATDVNMSSLYSTTGSGWSGPSQQNLYMQVVAVPEPSAITLLLVVAGLGVFLWLRARCHLARR